MKKFTGKAQWGWRGFGGSSGGAGTVTQIDTSAPLTGGPINVMGTSVYYGGDLILSICQLVSSNIIKI